LENKWLVFWLLSLSGSVAGNVIQEQTITEKTKEVKATQQQVTMVAESYHKTYKAPKQPTCQSCEALMKAHIREFH